MDQQQTPTPIPTPTPTPVSSEPHSSSLILVLIVLLILAALGAGAYFVWGSELWRMWMPQASEPAALQPAPQQTETSDLEAELQSIEFGSDAEIESLEAQL